MGAATPAPIQTAVNAEGYIEPIWYLSMTTNYSHGGVRLIIILV